MNDASTSNTPLISVVIPCHNCATTIQKLLRTFQRQSLKEWECICVDDSPSDDSYNVIKSFADKDLRIKAIRNPHSIGACSGRNLGISKASGEYIWFVDSDDECLLEPDDFAKMYSKLREKNADVCIFPCCYYRNGKPVNSSYDMNSHRGLYEKGRFTREEMFAKKNFSEIMSAVNTAPWNKIFSSKYLFANRMDLYFQEISFSEDVYFTYAMMKTFNSIAFQSFSPIYRYNSSPNTISGGKYSSEHISDVRLLFSWMQELNKSDAFSRVLLHRFLGCVDWILNRVLRYRIDSGIQSEAMFYDEISKLLSDEVSKFPFDIVSRFSILRRLHISQKTPIILPASTEQNQYEIANYSESKYSQLPLNNGDLGELKNSFVISIDNGRYLDLCKIFSSAGLSIPQRCPGVVAERRGDRKSMERALCLSHRKVLETAIKNNLKWYIDFEDDAYPCENVVTKLQGLNLPEADIYLLGYSWTKEKVTSEVAGWFEVKKGDICTGTHAILVRDTAYPFLLDAWGRTSMPADHIWGSIRFPEYSHLKILVHKDPFFIQYNKARDGINKHRGYIFYGDHEVPPKGFLPVENLRRDLTVTYITDMSVNEQKMLCVSMLSVLQNSGLKTINVVCTGLLPQTNLFIEEMKKAFGAVIDVIKIPGWLVSKCEQYGVATKRIKLASASSISLIKFELCNFLPERWTLFLDNDTLCLRPLTMLKRLTLKDNPKPFYAAKDNGWDSTIFNSGVMMMDLDWFRDKGISEKLWEMKKVVSNQRTMDQATFNALLKNIVSIIPYQYNSIVRGDNVRFRHPPKDAVILHFASKNLKPLTNEKVPFRPLWVEYYNHVVSYLHGKVPKIVDITQINGEPSSSSAQKVKDLPQDIVQTPQEKSSLKDVVFVLGNGSKCNDEELALAMKSLYKYCGSFIRKVYVVGAHPRCKLTEYKYTYLPCVDPYKESDKNIAYKIQYAIDRIPDLTEDFLKCSDDQFVTQPCTWEDFIPKTVSKFNRGSTQESFGKRIWEVRLFETLTKMSEMRRSVYYYEPHIWCQVNKKDFKKMLADMGGVQDVGVIWTQYYNYVLKHDREKIHDHVFFNKSITDRDDMLNLREMFMRRIPKFIAYNDNSFLNPYVRQLFTWILDR